MQPIELPPPKPRNFSAGAIIWRGSTALLAGIFAMSGAMKILGMQSMVEVFQQLPTGDWFRYVTGGLELLGAGLMVRRKTVRAGGILLSAIMIGAIYSHLALIDGSPLPAAILLALSMAVAIKYDPKHLDTSS